MTNIFAPFEPEGDEPRRRRFKPIPIRILLPNMVTLLSLCLGLTAIRMAMEDRLELAIASIIVAAVLDGLDGRIARLLQSSSRFGAELDSLADFVCFGVAPGIILFRWGLVDFRNFGWIATMGFGVCAALRLARFNVMLDDPNRPDYAGNFFVGVPAPAAAIIVLLPAYLEFLGVPLSTPLIVFAMLYVIAIALLMVSRVPTWSGKKIGMRVPRDYVLPVFVVVVLLAALLISFPWEVLTFGSLLYLAAIPVAHAHFRKLERAQAATDGGQVLPPRPEQKEGARLNRLN